MPKLPKRLCPAELRALLALAFRLRMSRSKTQRRVTRRIITVNEDGSFTLSHLSPGVFEITISAPGFAEARTTVTVSAGVESRADIVMHTESSTGSGEGAHRASAVS